MAQASLQLQQFVRWFQSASLHVADLRGVRWLSRLSQDWLSPEQLWGTVIVVALLIWNWQLVLALVVGAVVVVSIYLAQQGQWKIPQTDWRWMWTGANRSLTLAIASGSVAAFSAYITTGIWFEVDQSWLALGIILQGFGTLAVLLLLTWQTLNRQFETAGTIREDQRLDDLLSRLSDADPLQRLIAVRQITQRLQAEASSEASPLTLMPSAYMADCFRLMLNRETEPSVCSALLDGLQSLGQGRLNAATRQAVSVVAMRQKVEE